MKSGTYSELYVHIVFSTKYRQNLIQPSFEERLHQYITGIFRHEKCHLLAINGTENHIHILISLNLSKTVSDIVRNVKSRSTAWLKEQKLIVKGPFWQNGFSAFSHCSDSIEQAKKYIANQKLHHESVSFKSEYVKLLKDHGVKFDANFLFEEL